MERMKHRTKSFFRNIGSERDSSFSRSLCYYIKLACNSCFLANRVFEAREENFLVHLPSFPGQNKQR
jgi:hypothetical protein